MSEPIEFIDLKAQGERIRDEIDERIRRVLDHGIYILGPEIEELERRLATFVGDGVHCISVANGTDALLMPLMAWGVGPGDAVIVPSFTFMATAEVVSLIGATPVFADVDARTFLITPDSLERALERARAAGLRPRGVIPVDLFGQIADYDELRRVGPTGMFVLQDAAQSFGATSRGARAGAQGDVAATSFFPAKPLGCYGDGGAIFCRDAGMAAVLTSIRGHGRGADRYENVRIGINGRLDTIQAAVLLAKLGIFDEEIAARDRVAARYTSELGRLALPGLLPPVIHPSNQSVWAQYSLLCEDSETRTRLTGALKRRGVPTQIYYPRPLHLQKAFAGLGYREGDLPVSEDLARRIFSLPMHPYLDARTQDRILRALAEARAEPGT